MKKIILVLAALAAVSSFANEAKKHAVKKPKATTEAMAPKKEEGTPAAEAPKAEEHKDEHKAH